MNDTELDRLLDTWEAPAPPASLRKDLRARFPQAERRSFTHPLRWVLAIGVAAATLAIGTEQSGTNPWDFRIVRIVSRLYEDFLDGIAARQASSTVARIRQSAPKVYVDGELVAPLEYGHAAMMHVEVPGEGTYWIIAYSRAQAGWVESGRIHGSAIEFQAGSKHVRIECNRPIVDSDLPVFIMRRP